MLPGTFRPESAPRRHCADATDVANIEACCAKHDFEAMPATRKVVGTHAAAAQPLSEDLHQSGEPVTAIGLRQLGFLEISLDPQRSDMRLPGDAPSPNPGAAGSD
jgi:hypothetical protein